MLRILIVDDHALVRRGIRELLRDLPEAQFGEAANAEDALRQLRQRSWDIALLDISMPGKSGFELLSEIKSAVPKLPVLLVSAHAEEEYAVRSLKAGAAGYVTKESSPEELVHAIQLALSGRRYVSSSVAEKLADQLGADDERPAYQKLSDREFEVMRLVVSGKSLKEIAALLAVSPKTVTSYRSRILEKLDVKTNAEMIRYAIEKKLFD